MSQYKHRKLLLTSKSSCLNEVIKMGNWWEDVHIFTHTVYLYITEKLRFIQKLHLTKINCQIVVVMQLLKDMSRERYQSRKGKISVKGTSYFNLGNICKTLAGVYFEISSCVFYGW